MTFIDDYKAFKEEHRKSSYPIFQERYFFDDAFRKGVKRQDMIKALMEVDGISEASAEQKIPTRIIVRCSKGDSLDNLFIESNTGTDKEATKTITLTVTVAEEDVLQRILQETIKANEELSVKTKKSLLESIK